MWSKIRDLICHQLVIWQIHENQFDLADKLPLNKRIKIASNKQQITNINCKFFLIIYKNSYNKFK